MQYEIEATEPESRDLCTVTERLPSGVSGLPFGMSAV